MGDKLTSNDRIVFECPKCLGIVESSRESAGQRIECPDCSASLLVPDLGGTAGSFDDLFDDLSGVAGEQLEKNIPSVSDEEPLPFDSEETLTEIQETSQLSLDDPAVLENNSEALVDNDFILEETAVIEEETSSQEPFDLEMALEKEEPEPIDASVASKDPFLVDEDAPIKIDGLEMDVTSDEVFGVKCSICDTRIHVNLNQVGGNVACPVCFSEVAVSPPIKKPEPKAPWQSPSQEPATGEGELTLEDPVDLPKVDYGIEPGYGLAPVDSDLLAPIEPLEDEIVDLEILDDVPPESAKPRSSSSLSSLIDDEILGIEPLVTEGDELSTGQDRRPLVPSSTAPDPPVGNRETSVNKPESSANRKQNSDSVDDQSKTQSEATSNSQQKQGVDWKQLIAWLREVFKSPQLLIRTLVSTVMFAIGYSYFESFNTIWGDLEMDSTSRMVGLIIRGFLGGLFWLPSALLFTITFAILYRDSVEGDSKVDQWPGAGFSEWFGSFAFVAFSFWVAALPGLLLGNVLYIASEKMIFLLLLVPFSVFMIMPICLVNALFNESVVNIVSPDIMKSLTLQKSKWLGFYKTNLILLAVFTLGTLVLYLPTIVFSLLGAVIQVAAVVGLAAALGLHTRRIVDGIVP